MGESKVYYFGQDAANANNGLLASILPALSNRGIDTAALMGMMGNNNGGLFGGRGFEDIIALIIVAAIFGNGNGFGFGGGNNANNSAERELLANMIQRNGTDLSQLAQTLGCSNSRIVDAIGQVSTQICNLGAQNGQSFMQVINAIQAGNTAITSQICNCCCDLKQLIGQYGAENRLAICQQTNQLTNAINSVAVGQERGFSSVAYATAQQTCDITKAIADNTAQVLAGQRAAEMREMQDKIDRLREENGTYKTSAMTSQIVAQATAPIGAVVNDLSKRLGAIECKLPDTITINKNNGVYLDQCCAAQLGLNGFGLGYGFGINGSPFFG